MKFFRQIIFSFQNCGDVIVKYSSQEEFYLERAKNKFIFLLFGMVVHQVDHPLIKHKITLLRDHSVKTKQFRELTREITTILCYEATRDLPTSHHRVHTPIAPADGHRISASIGLVPILRAGLGIVEGFLDLLPAAQVWHIGMYRDPKTLAPVEYYNKLPCNPTVDIVYVLDLMLATGGTAIATTHIVKQWGVKNIKLVCLVAAPEGIRAFESEHPDVPVVVCAVDERLNEKSYIVPGLGDAGDRLCNTLATH